MGDALAVLYEKMIGLSKEGFAFNHPGGILGKSLRMKVEDLMVGFYDCPRCCPETSLQDVILSMTENPVGACAILDSKNVMKGIVVDGYIRGLRLWQRYFKCFCNRLYDIFTNLYSKR